MSRYIQLTFGNTDRTRHAPSMMSAFFRFQLARGFSMGPFASGHAYGEYGHLTSWRLLRGRADPSAQGVPAETRPADAVDRADATVDVAPLQDEQDLRVLREMVLRNDSGRAQAGNNGNLTVQPDVTRGTIGAYFATSGAAMDSKPVPSLERAFARTEVAGLDELPKPASEPQQAAAPAVPAARPLMVERRGAPPADPSRPAAAAGSGGLSLFSQQRLEPEAERWLKALPVAVRPVITAKRHPHIINKFARFWGRTDLVCSYLDELLISNRPGRRGFAMEVLEELSLLQGLVQERRLS